MRRRGRCDGVNTTPGLLTSRVGHDPIIVCKAYGFRQRPPDAGALFVPIEELVPSSSTAPERQKDEMPDVAAGNRGDEEHPGERLKRVAVQSDED